MNMHQVMWLVLEPVEWDDCSNEYLKEQVVGSDGPEVMEANLIKSPKKHHHCA